MMSRKKEADCPYCEQPWASQAHYDLQSCSCLHQTDDADAYTVLVAVADCARRWVPDARIIGSVRAADILKACNAATALLAPAPSNTPQPDKEDPKNDPT